MAPGIALKHFADVSPKKLKKLAKAQEGAAADEPDVEVDTEAAAARKQQKKEKKKRREQGGEEEEEKPAKGEKKPKDKKRKQAEADDAEDAEEEEEKAPKKLKASRKTDAEYRKEHSIVVPADCPTIFQTFDEADFPPALIAALKSQGFDAPTPIQAATWPIAITMRDIVAVAKTGSGKTCGYLLPALSRIAKEGPVPPCKNELVNGRWETEATKPVCIVLAPTRELAIQIGDEANRFAKSVKAKVVVVYGGTGKIEQLTALRGGADVCVATPGRLSDFLEPPSGRSPPIEAKAARYLVLDEADRMLDMGFEPQIRKIVAMCPQGAQRQTLMFTATWPTAVQRAARAFTSASAAQVRIGENGNKLVANTSITQHVEILREDEKLDRTVALCKERKAELTIVFSGTKRRCDMLEQTLRRAGLPVAGAIHGDKDQWQREQALGRFKDGKGKILIATDVAARGIDIPGVQNVIIFDFPGDTADYIHRIGRTGRAGAKGCSVTLFTRNNAPQAKELVQILVDAKQEVPQGLRDLVQQRGGGGGGGGGRFGGRGGRGGGGGGGGFRRGGGRGGGGGRGRKW